MLVSDGVTKWLERTAIALITVLMLLVAWYDLADAADLAVKPRAVAPATIPLTGCGPYFGVNTMGSAGAVSGSPVPGASVVEGELGAQIGYTCANADGSFYFFEGKFDFANVNGATNGLSLSGPLHFQQRIGYGSPAFMQMLGSLPGISNISTPSLPLLPPGVTAGPAAGYFYGALNEQDVSAQFIDPSTGFTYNSNKIWGIAGELGVGMWYRLSNGVVADVFAGYRIRSAGLCLGLPGGQCPGMGNMGVAGFQFNF